ncbi:MBL fold metallo-hydrolase, partial [Streptomyces sp. SID10244]|nr:MBL fold metallo-hydrolase [Streptomyces sp. SID10244]
DFADEVRALGATWLGHASVLVELDGLRVLTDPVFSRRCSPASAIGPARMHAAPAHVADLPSIDVVLISHDHYDHLDMPTVVDLAARQPDVRFVAPIGVGAHLMSWGI